MGKTSTYQGIVLKKTPYRDSDLILHIFTKEEGKVAVFAGGAKKSTKRFGPYLDLFAEVELTVIERQNNQLLTLKETSLIHPHLEVRSGLAAFSFMTYYTECLTALIAEHDPHPEIFDRLLNLMNSIESWQGNYQLLFEIEYELLKMCGYNPNFLLCGECKKTVELRGFFVFSTGSMVCSSCKPFGQVKILGPNAIEALHTHQIQDLQTYKELRELLVDFVTHTVGKPLKSHAFRKESVLYV